MPFPIQSLLVAAVVAIPHPSQVLPPLAALLAQDKQGPQGPQGPGPALARVLGRRQAGGRRNPRRNRRPRSGLPAPWRQRFLGSMATNMYRNSSCHINIWTDTDTLKFILLKPFKDDLLLFSNCFFPDHSAPKKAPRHRKASTPEVRASGTEGNIWRWSSLDAPNIQKPLVIDHSPGSHFFFLLLLDVDLIPSFFWHHWWPLFKPPLINNQIGWFSQMLFINSLIKPALKVHPKPFLAFLTRRWRYFWPTWQQKI